MEAELETPREEFKESENRSSLPRRRNGETRRRYHLSVEGRKSELSALENRCSFRSYDACNNRVALASKRNVGSSRLRAYPVPLEPKFSYFLRVRRTRNLSDRVAYRESSANSAESTSRLVSSRLGSARKPFPEGDSGRCRFR